MLVSLTAVGAHAAEEGGDHQHGRHVDQGNAHGLQQEARAVRLDMSACTNERSEEKKPLNRNVALKASFESFLGNSSVSLSIFFLGGGEPFSLKVDCVLFLSWFRAPCLVFSSLPFVVRVHMLQICIHTAKRSGLEDDSVEKSPKKPADSTQRDRRNEHENVHRHHLRMECRERMHENARAEHKECPCREKKKNIQ